MEKLVETATTFAKKLSSESAVTRASKSLQAEITQRESNKRENMDSNEPFVPTESSIREIIRQEIHHTKEPHTASGNRQRKVSFSDNSGRRSRTKHQPHSRKKSKSPQNRTKEQRKQQSQKQDRSSHRVLVLANGSLVLVRRQKTRRAKVPAPQRRQTLLGSLKWRNDLCTTGSLETRQAKVLGLGLKFRPSLKPPTAAQFDLS